MNCMLLCVVIQAQSISDYPWLSNVLDQGNCCFNNSVDVYEQGSSTYLYISKDMDCAGQGGILYNSDGLEWCRDRDDLDCISFYELSFSNTLYDCEDMSEFDFLNRFPWLNQIIDLENCCDNQSLTLYRDENNHEYICISGNQNCSSQGDRWYYQNGDLFCMNTENYNCPEAYGFSEMDIISEWNCEGDNAGTMTNFTVTIENVMEGRDYLSSGTTGLILPGESSSISFDAGLGHYLSFATMFVQSNDLFIGPDQNGIPLYNENGQAKIGDITEYIALWDAGTEVNEEPGTGANQAPRQSGPNTGEIENGNVQLVNDGFDYPAVNETVQIELSHDGGTAFTMTINNISDNSSIPTPFAPGVWVINTADQSPLFTTGNPSSIGLENIAEDGDNSILHSELTNNSGLVSPFAPGSYALNNPVFEAGQVSTQALEALAEDGNPGGFENRFAIPLNANSPGPLFPGQAYSFSFSASEGDVLSFATMFVQSNDWFLGANDIILFENGQALSGDISNLIGLYDSGTEVDEHAGAGANQAPRQSGPNTGVAESGIVEIENNPGSHVPGVGNIIRVTLSSK